MPTNNHVLLVMGKPNSGKTTSLRNLANPDKFVYLNSDLKLPSFKPKFYKQVEISDAINVLDYINQIESNPNVSGVAFDTLTFLMSMYERQYVINSPNTQKSWGDYGNFYREFIHAIKSGTKDYVIFAHEDSFLNEQTMQLESRVPVKGSVGKTGVNQPAPLHSNV